MILSRSMGPTSAKANTISARLIHHGLVSTHVRPEFSPCVVERIKEHREHVRRKSRVAYVLASPHTYTISPPRRSVGASLRGLSMRIAVGLQTTRTSP